MVKSLAEISTHIMANYQSDGDGMFFMYVFYVGNAKISCLLSKFVKQITCCKNKSQECLHLQYLP